MSLQEQRFKDIANAIRSKTGKTDPIKAVNFAEEINTIEVPENWVSLDLSTKKKLIYKKYDTIIICSNNIDCYGSNSSESKGTYHFNLLTGEETKLNDYYMSSFFETSNGNVFAGLWSGDYGIALLSGTTLTKIYTTGYGFKYWFEASNGYVYVSTQENGETGIVCINGTTATRVYTLGYEWAYFFEASNGYVYVGSSYSSLSKGVIVLNETSATQILADYWCWTNFYETKNNNVYVFGYGTASRGVYHLSETTATQIISNNWNIYYEANNGSLYISNPDSSGIKLVSGTSINDVLLNGSTISGSRWNSYFKDSKGNVYVSSSSQSGLLNLSGTTATRITSNYNNYEKLYEASNGKIYSLSSQTSTGANTTKYNLFVINDDLSISLVYVSVFEYKYLTERTEGIIASKTEQPDGQDFLLIDKETDQVYLMKE